MASRRAPLRSDRAALAAWAVLAVLTGLALWSAARAWPTALTLQFAGSGDSARRALDDVAHDAVRRSIGRDWWAIAGYAALGATTAARWRRGLDLATSATDRLDWRRPWRWPRRTRRTVTVAVVGVAAAADVVENLLTLTLLDRLAAGRDIGPLAGALTAAAVVKWALLAVAGWSIVVMARQELPRPAPLERPVWPPWGTCPQTDHDVLASPRSHAVATPQQWEPPGKGDEPRIGISCSGGGIRSASFCLGALQALRAEGTLRRARYVTAVSGGSYVASAIALASTPGAAGEDPPEPPLDDLAAFDPGSPEEAWLRRNVRYLAPDPGTALGGLARIVTGLGIGLVLLWLVTFAVARPAGWVIGGWLHPELRARTPIVQLDRQPDLDRALLEVTPAGDGAPGERLYTVHLTAAGGEARVWRDVDGRDETVVGVGASTRALDPIGADRGTPALVAVRDGRLSVLRQPLLVPTVDDLEVLAALRDPTNADPARDGLVVTRSPEIALRAGAIDAAAGPAEILGLLELDGTLRLRQYSGLTGRPAPTFDAWQWWLAAGLAGAGLAVFVLGLVRRPLRPAPGNTTGPVDGALSRADRGWVRPTLLVLGAGWFVVALALPWAVRAIPPWTASLVGNSTPLPTRPDGGSTANALPAVIGYLGLSAGAVWAVVGRTARRFPRQVLGVAATVVLVGVGAFHAIVLTQFAAANGPAGAITGLGIGVWLADLVRWIGVLAALAVLWAIADAHSWSVFPYYKRRLSRAFALRRRRGYAEEIPYDETPTPFTTFGTLDGGPELVVCAALNVADDRLAASGRRAVSFTFSRSEVGSPQLGYVPTPLLESVLGPGRLPDVTVNAAMAMSGAAVSPAMGRQSLGPLGRLLAVLNVRLGVWLPNPRWLHALADTGDQARWDDRPRWTYFAREVLGRFRADERYVYVTDGGHWENLGLVELLRRGCTEVYCISAAGDGPDRFTTIGEAITLAQAELGVRIDIDLDPLRAPWPDATTAPDRSPLRRGGGAPSPWAPRGWAAGTLRYPDGRRGVLLVVEANLTRSVPWLVQATAEADARFPNHSTAQQLFTDELFEAYATLGRHQMRKGLRAGSWRAAVSDLTPRRSHRARPAATVPAPAPAEPAPAPAPEPAPAEAQPRTGAPATEAVPTAVLPLGADVDPGPATPPFVADDEFDDDGDRDAFRDLLLGHRRDDGEPEGMGTEGTDDERP
jgi:hypothetical protein